MSPHMKSSKVDTYFKKEYNRVMFTLPDLPYAYTALEPHIDEETMRIHHDKHHATYVDKLNAALENNPELLALPIEELMSNLNTLPGNIREAVRNHGGGHINHSLFWSIMSPQGGGKPTGELARNIDSTFTSFEGFQEEFAKVASTHFGSGWAWLVVDNGTLRILSLPNQDTPVSNGLSPILGLDIWEHAYYLHYQNRRPDYVKAWWEVVNWPEVERIYTMVV